MSKRLRFGLIVTALLLAAWFIFPTLNWYFLSSEEDKELASKSLEFIRETAISQTQDRYEEFDAILNDTPDEPLGEEWDDLVAAAERKLNRIGNPVPDVWTARGIWGTFARQPNDIKDVIERTFRESILGLKESRAGTLTFGLDLFGGMSIVLEPDFDSIRDRRSQALEEGEELELTDQDRQDIIDRSIEILYQRISSLGLREPIIKKEASGRLLFIDIPGEVDQESVNTFLQGSGSMQFAIVDETTTDNLRRVYRGWDNDEFLRVEESLVPPGTEVFQYWTTDQYGIVNQFEGRLALFTDENRTMDGIHVIDASVRPGQSGRPNDVLTIFELDDEGREIFANLTTNYQEERMAIVLDGRIRSAPLIREPIPGGSANITGLSVDEGLTLQKILKTGALPLQFNLKSVSQVGASLGADQIEIGLWSIAIGLLLVLVFMIIYYKGSGIAASLGLIVNLILLVSVLSIMGLTATLTSIAGLILTIGMSVDANVIIFERIKEERREGKSPGASVLAGFKKAFWTIMDANITTLIAALFLSLLSSGPIQGFAVTLSVGVLTSMFSALFVTRFLFDFVLDNLEPKNLSISWRTK
jgi:preprotein translocase subunit SecD